MQDKEDDNANTLNRPKLSPVITNAEIQVGQKIGKMSGIPVPKSSSSLAKGKENSGPRPLLRPSKLQPFGKSANAASPNLDSGFKSSSSPNLDPYSQSNASPNSNNPGLSTLTCQKPTESHSTPLQSSSNIAKEGACLKLSESSTTTPTPSTQGTPGTNNIARAPSANCSQTQYNRPTAFVVGQLTSPPSSGHYMVSPGELTSKLLLAGSPKSRNSTPKAASIVSYDMKGQSPGLLSSKAAPGIQNILLGAIRANKRRSQNPTPNQSPCRAPAPHKTLDDEIAEVFTGQGESDSSVGSVSTSRPGSSCDDRLESSANEEELNAHFKALFKSVDEYRAGVVPSRRLLDHLLSYVDLPELDQWKIDELSRLLDPSHDNRFVDEDQFVAVGKRWAEMIMSTESGNDDVLVRSQRSASVSNLSSSSGNNNLSWNRSNTVVSNNLGSRKASDPGNLSYGSVEGLGGMPGCDSKEVELENKCSELRYQLYRQQEEYTELQRALAVSEENVGSLAVELEAAKGKIASLTSGLERVSSTSEEAEAVVAAGKIAEERCCSLSAKVEELRERLREKESELEESEQASAKLTADLAKAHRKEQTTVSALALKEAEVVRLLEELEAKDVVNQDLQRQQWDKEGELELAEKELVRLEVELGVRDVEIKNLTSADHSGPLSHSTSINGANVLDVSVDDKVLMEMSGSNSPTPRKIILPHTPLHRGPSASSTPNRSRRETILEEELKESGCLPSPLCGKGIHEQKLYNRLQSEIGRWQDKVRRTIIEEGDPSTSGKLISAVNKIMDQIKKDILKKANSASDDVFDETEELKKELEDVKAELAQCKQDLLKEKAELEAEKERLEDIEVVEKRVTEMASLLQVANRALLAVGKSVSRENSRPTSPAPVESADQSIEEDLLGDWQLDLEGIELIKWNNNLSRNLLQYSKQLREDMSRMEGSRTGGAGPTRLWLSSLYNRLEELYSETEKSRDLLMLAGDSMREDAHHQLLLSQQQLQLSQQQHQFSQQQHQLSQVQPAQELDSQLAGPGLRFPKTQGCQTDETDLPRPEIPTPAVADADKTASGATTAAEASGGLWSWLRNLVGLLVLVTLFTFVCGCEYEGRVYYPITYSPLRSLGWVPAPIISMRYTRTPQFW